MKEWLLNRYTISIFNTCPYRAFYCMADHPIDIHLEPSAKPIACHAPATIPHFRWQQQIHEDLHRNEALGILEKFTRGEPTEWCHLMIITRKHKGTSRLTEDLSPLISSVNVKHLL